MGRFSDKIEAHRDTATEQPTTDARGQGANSPFSMQYDLEEYELDTETIDQMLSVTVALTNLL